jgi:drug/metabolite transporter (DMT)-like permease
MLMGLIALFISQLIAGAIGPTVIKIGVSQIPPFTFTELRFLVATILFLPFFMKNGEPHLNLQQVLRIIPLAVCLFINIVFFSFAIQYTTVIVVNILYIFGPVCVGIGSYFFLGETLTRRKILGLAVAMTGIVLLLYQSLTKQQHLTFGTPLGNILGIIAVFGFSLYYLFSKKLSSVFSTTTLTFYGFFMNVFFLLPFSAVELLYHPLQPGKISYIGVSSIIIAAVFPSVLLYFLLQFGIKRAGAFTASLFQYMGPFIGAFVSIPLFGEKPSFSLAISGVCIIAGVFIATSRFSLSHTLHTVLQ